MVILINNTKKQIYRVIIGRNMSCSCPDYMGHCKHLLMVLLKVFHTNASSEAYRTLKINTNVGAFLYIHKWIYNSSKGIERCIYIKEVYHVFLDLTYRS